MIYGPDFIVVILFIITYSIHTIYTFNADKDIQKIKSKYSSNRFLESLNKLSVFMVTPFTFMWALEQTYFNGILGIIVVLICNPVSYIIVGIFLVKNLIKSKRDSIYEWISYYYGDDIRVIFSLCETLSNVALVAIQMKIVKHILDTIFTCESTILMNTTMILFTITVITRAISNDSSDSLVKNIVNMIILLIIPILTLLLVMQYDIHLDFLNVLDSANNEKMSLKTHFSIPNILISLSLITRFLFPFVDTTIYADMKKADKKYVITNYITSGSLLFFFVFFVVILGLLVFFINPNLNPNQLLTFILEIIKIPTVKGFFICSLLFLSLNISVTTLKSVSSLILKDNIKMLILTSKEKEEKLYKIIISLISISALLITKISSNVTDILLYCSLFNFPIFIPQLTLTIIGLRTHKNCIYMSMLCGFITSFIFIFSTYDTEYCKYAFFPGTVANMLTLIISHLYYKLHKGFKFNKPEIDEVTEMEEKKIYEEKSNTLIDTARTNLILKLKTLFIENEKDTMTDAEILNNFISKDLTKTQLEYKIYKLYICKFRLSMNINIEDGSIENNEDFKKVIETDIKEYSKTFKKK